MWLADLHVHSNFSDGKHSIPELVDFYGERGFGAIAITDHVCEENTFLGKAARYFNQCLTRATFPLYIEILKSEAARAKKKYNMLVIPGLELSKNSVANRRSAHVLGLGLADYLTADGDPVDLARSIRARGGLTIAAHPVSTRKLEPQTYYLWSQRERLAKEFDAWEVASGAHLFNEVLESGLPMIATSDLHHIKQIQSWKTVFSGARDVTNVFESIRNQDLAFEFYRESANVDLSATASGTVRFGPVVRFDGFHNLRNPASAPAF